MNNPPAFPMTGFETRNGQGIQSVHHTGMTLRDYFAAKAMQGMYANGSFPTGIMLDTAKEAYEMADAMLKAREE
jgi:hypothetical protein